jgi:lysophospholipase L1-like esterase
VAVAPAASLAALRAVLAVAATAGWAALVVGPPPVDDEPRNVRIGALSTHFAALCDELNVPYVATFPVLHADPVWRDELRRGDGAHPGGVGYALLASIVEAPFATWLAGAWPRQPHPAPIGG